MLGSQKQRRRDQEAPNGVGRALDLIEAVTCYHDVPVEARTGLEPCPADCSH